MKVAVVGLGAMGSRIATRLLTAGHDLVVWNRSPEKLDPLLAQGAVVAVTPAEAATRADVLITMVAGPEALRAVSDGRDGLFAGAGAPLTVIEMSTVGPAAVLELARKLPAGVTLVDAPVLGSTAAAEAGTLTVFAGGPDDVVVAVRPLLERLGTVHHVGKLASGAAAKLVANAALLGSVASACRTKRRTTCWRRHHWPRNPSADADRSRRASIRGGSRCHWRERTPI